MFGSRTGPLLQRLERVWRQLDEQAPRRQDADKRALLTVVVSGVTLVFLHYVVLRGHLQEALAEQLPLIAGDLLGEVWQTRLLAYRELIQICGWAIGSSFFYMALPCLVIRLVYRERLADWGLSTAGYLRHLGVYAALFVPVGSLVLLVSTSPAFQFAYPFYRQPHGVIDLVCWELMYAGQFVALEFFFRGFMVRGLEPRYGNGAVLVMVLPYTMIHFQKPMFETFGAIVAGLVLGVLALRTRSIWGGATIHIAVAWTMDAAAMSQKVN